MKMYLEMLHSGLLDPAGTAPTLLDWDGLSVWDSTSLFLTGLPPLHSPGGACLAPWLCSLDQDHCGSLGDFRGCWAT